MRLFGKQSHKYPVIPGSHFYFKTVSTLLLFNLEVLRYRRWLKYNDSQNAITLFRIEKHLSAAR
jgi:hypothetical protein